MNKSADSIYSSSCVPPFIVHNRFMLLVISNMEQSQAEGLTAADRQGHTAQTDHMSWHTGSVPSLRSHSLIPCDRHSLNSTMQQNAERGHIQRWATKPLCWVYNREVIDDCDMTVYGYLMNATPPHFREKYSPLYCWQRLLVFIFCRLFSYKTFTMTAFYNDNRNAF